MADRLQDFLKSQGTEPGKSVSSWEEFYSKRHASRASFIKVRKAEESYARRLRKLANHIHDIIHDFVVGNDFTPEALPFNLSALVNLLRRYAEIINPWAVSVASRMIAETARRDVAAWKSHSREISRNLQQEIQAAPTGEAMREFLSTQVRLIRSIPEDAAQRVHDIAVGNLYQGIRYSGLIDEIIRTGQVSKAKATLIARTETSRVASTLTMVRAKQIGATHYIWMTMGDEIVRPSHKHMNGKICEWANPPVVDVGKPPYHAGMIYNCRCVPVPIIPDKFG